MTVSIVIPAHNEEKRISKTLEEYGRFFNEKLENKEIDNYEILVVLNACEDNTLAVVKKFQKKNKKIKYLDFKLAGKGFAIIEGYKDVLQRNIDLVGFVDADMATPPESFYDLVKSIKGHDGIIASRWLKGSVIKTKQTILRRITSRGFNFLVRSLLFLPYSDSQCGAKLFKRSVVKTVVVDLGITKWAFDVDLLYKIKRKGFKIKEIPTIWEDKKESKLNLTKVPFQMLSSIIRLRLLYSPFKFIVRLYDKMPEKIKIHH